LNFDVEALVNKAFLHKRRH